MAGAETGGETAAIETKPVTDPAVVEFQKRVEDAFNIFDHDHNGTVDVR